MSPAQDTRSLEGETMNNPRRGAGGLVRIVSATAVTVLVFTVGLVAPVIAPAAASTPPQISTYGLHCFLRFAPPQLAGRALCPGPRLVCGGDDVVCSAALNVRVDFTSSGLTGAGSYGSGDYALHADHEWVGPDAKAVLNDQTYSLKEWSPNPALNGVFNCSARGQSVQCTQRSQTIVVWETGGKLPAGSGSVSDAAFVSATAAISGSGAPVATLVTVSVSLTVVRYTCQDLVYLPGNLPSSVCQPGGGG